MDPHEHLMGPSHSPPCLRSLGQGAARSRVCLMERCPRLDQQVLRDGLGCG